MASTVYAAKVVFTCDESGREVTVTDGYISGGCIGHSDDDPYCYCDSPHFEAKCPGCGGVHMIYL